MAEMKKRIRASPKVYEWLSNYKTKNYCTTLNDAIKEIILYYVKAEKEKNNAVKEVKTDSVTQ